jgi:carbon monoxide dehydrogenase subunit G
MKVQGEYLLPLDQQAAWDLLLNTDVLSRAIPGCESLVPIGPDEYQMNMKVALSSMQGLFSGKVRIADKNPISSYRLIVEGQGKLGFVRGEGVLSLMGDAASTRVSFTGEVQVSGLIASVGERMLDMTTKMMIKKFFTALVKEAASPAGRSNASQ